MLSFGHRYYQFHCAVKNPNWANSVESNARRTTEPKQEPLNQSNYIIEQSSIRKIR